ncbi:MAG: trypsin-like peptidase domain-containing protein [Candidatus Marinimicrobia bacterium]|nr:trypsin-like peptidase domain-containing protein [Candidatus Neomarinimicrobiota bacterium]MBL7009620.1 trypsin-like peptidase domain-containing protein [Candidatus Neomarinimicrobiota bacterium]MBL7029637.1 trypsin-like peptidase domain-containing protein [Candidatus Neomarinimicrobiota bacterium]
MKVKLIKFIIGIFGIVFLNGQISVNGEPKSFSISLEKDVPVLTMQTVNVDSLTNEDKKATSDTPYRFGYGFDVSYNLDNSGVWETLPDGGRVWRLNIFAPGAFSINLIYDQFWLPPGATLFLYNPTKSMVLGAFTERNNKEYGKFSTSLVDGPITILEYYEPKNMKKKGVIQISRIIHGYKDIFKFAQNKIKRTKIVGFGDAASCEVNARCYDETYDNMIRSVGLIITNGGTEWCSGAIVNNVNNNYTPYFLTANHCLDGYQNTWLVWFNYESASCSNPYTSPTPNAISGMTLKANNSASDFALLELSQKPPASYNVYLAGWSNINTAPQSSVGIHHPQGDIKKLSIDNDYAISSYVTNTPTNSHWYVIDWETGSTEPGSSGSPLFDLNNRIIGQDHAGNGYDPCDSLKGTYYGKFSMSWDYGGSSSSQLKNWLDPNNTGATILNGLSVSPIGVFVTGPSSLGFLVTGTFSANQTGGYPNDSATYKWYKKEDGVSTWSFRGTGSSHDDKMINTNFTLKVVMTKGGETTEATKYVTYGSGGGFDPKILMLPESYALSQNYPNPFNPTTTIKYELPAASFITLVIYDLKGNEVTRWSTANESAGYKRKTWNATDKNGNKVPAGMYLLKMTAESKESREIFTETKKMVLLK